MNKEHTRPVRIGSFVVLTVANFHDSRYPGIRPAWGERNITF